MCRNAAQRIPAAFTLVELIVVITVIVILLAIGVPALSTMNADARQTSAQQTINGTLVRAYYLAQAEQAMTAVRFFPAEWDAVDPNKAQESRGRQAMAILRYVGPTTMTDSTGKNFSVAFNEYFERARQTESVLLPEDVWAAPLEALQKTGQVREGAQPVSYSELGRDFVLHGTVGAFAYNADARDPNGSDGGSLLDADDFLILCDPRTGVRSGIPAPFQIRAYAPVPPPNNIETDKGPTGIDYRRYAFSGVVTYRREPFMTATAGLGDPKDMAQARQDQLFQRGRPYMIQRFSGALISAARRPQ